MSKTDNVGQVDIYGEIVPEAWRWEGEESATSFKNTLEKLKGVDEIVVNINSPGGDVFEGIAIHNMLKRHKAKVTVNIDGLAASIASVIAMAGDVVRMPSNSMLMIHNAMSGTFGNANDLREVADLLEKVTGTLIETYLNKSDKLKTDSLKALLDAETWMTAEEAFSYGLIDEVITSKKLVACASKERLAMYNKTPNKVLKMVETPEETVTEGKDNVTEDETLTTEEIKDLIIEVVNEELDKYDLTKKEEVTNKIKNRLYL
ncbi:head maturation protease, ClpP-related [Macrococcus hajekii]|nr:head maturation protease, ClpP-related [Macrococcus hajekii]